MEISPNDKFSLYLHENSQKPVSIPLSLDNIYVENHLVSVGSSPKIKVVEHLFSALYGLNLFNVRVDIFGDEIPFFDGSSQEFVKSLRKIKKLNVAIPFRVRKEILIKEKNSFIHYEPLENDSLVIAMALTHPFIKTQKIALTINKETYIKEIAPARTFAFTTEDDPRLRNLPPYGIGVTRNQTYCVTSLRFSNELVRHKVLDLLGDLYVLQKNLVGKIIGKNTSHQLNLKFVKELTE